MYYLRKLIKRNNWTKYHGETDYRNLSWIKYKNDFPSEIIFKELNADNNELSFYRIDQDKSNLERVLAALGANRESIKHIDYVLINVDIIKYRKFNFIKTPGLTPDININDNYHWIFQEITGYQLAKLTKLILDSGVFKRIKPRDMTRCIANSLQSGHLERTRINSNILAKIEG